MIKINLKIFICFFVIAIVFLFISCELISPSSKVKSRILDSFSNNPIADATIVARPSNAQLEEITTASDNDGSYILKGFTPNINYTITITKIGYSTASTWVKAPKEGEIKEISYSSIYKLPPSSNGVFAFINNQYYDLTYVNVPNFTFNSNVPFYYGGTFYNMSCYYIPSEVLSKMKLVKLSNNDFVVLPIGNQRWFLTPLFDISIKESIKRYFEAPNESYDYPGYFPKGLYCGISEIFETGSVYGVASNTLGYREKKYEIGNVEYFRLNFPKGKYILTQNIFSYWTGMAYRPTRNSPKYGWIFEIE